MINSANVDDEVVTFCFKCTERQVNINYAYWSQQLINSVQSKHSMYPLVWKLMERPQNHRYNQLVMPQLEMLVLLDLAKETTTMLGIF